MTIKMLGLIIFEATVTIKKKLHFYRIQGQNWKKHIKHFLKLFGGEGVLFEIDANGC